MAETILKHGSILNAASKEEIRELLMQFTTRQDTRQRVRAPGSVTLDANGNGVAVVYKVPAGYEFEVRRVFVDNGTASPSTGSVLLVAAGRSLAYQRSGRLIEYAMLQTYVAATMQIPGIQTWGDQQGPYLANGEAFELNFVGFPVNTTYGFMIEGILTKGGSLK